MGVLYVVATPIGNMEDITLRALRVLQEVDLIAAEDTRTTRKLLNRYSITGALTSYHKHNSNHKLPILLEALADKDVAIVSDAGMPGVSDPGYELVRQATEKGIQVVPIPGPSAVVASVAVAGIPANGYLFLGFLPRRKGERRRLLESIKELPHMIVAFEAPHRVTGTLEDLLATLQDREMTVCRELTKLHEEVFRGTIADAVEHFKDPRGEFTLVIAPADVPQPDLDLERIKVELAGLKQRGMKAREAVATVSRATGAAKKQVYRIWLETDST